MNLNANKESQASLDARKQLLSQLAEMSSQVSTLDGAVLVSLLPGGEVKICSDRLKPMALANIFEGIARTIRENHSEELSPEEEFLEFLRMAGFSEEDDDVSEEGTQE